jgi:hypothetical protein
MTNLQTDIVAKAIYNERGRTGVGWLKWEEQTETVKDIWRGCALAALQAINSQAAAEAQP